MTHARVVDKGDDEDVADLAVQCGPGRVPVEGPQLLTDAGSDLNDCVAHGHGQAVLGGTRRRLQGRVVRLPTRSRGGVEVDDRFGLARGRAMGDGPHVGRIAICLLYTSPSPRD